MTRAQGLLGRGSFTCVLCKGDVTLTSSARGVAPLLAWLASKKDLAGFSAADKVVGRAAAFLYVLMGVGAVFADTMSEGAQDVLLAHGIETSMATLADHIVNRAGTGPCPMEDAVHGIDDPEQALEAIKVRLAELRGARNCS
ncbi:MAG: DUF1893 domain-containing protein [Atopobiaceae bacterium]|nr:DUF1893 domain-containing protein [Atopobiaceae bacterium]MCH4179910.1 DUF1893 domain-containing protein [Atopobiaceae bacterium]MCH4213661.1 DUF1893 domain-containing protein [Atopobiaceae bacterium]MCH4230516.1 DUF1893 domain-containing protein [Atopobiaceae bacterium]MCH4275982.1 DUF1893 domain-containing protein [Atopobiaceae bacterium]